MVITDFLFDIQKLSPTSIYNIISNKKLNIYNFQTVYYFIRFYRFFLNSILKLNFIRLFSVIWKDISCAL